ncbi:calcium-binding protein [Flexibacterium corallicola]|uniref:calcium-binding protein n=1 Tax=Flexibacterium corallicola TaxID=3037259 RepID=UPI00286F03B0|nr:hypothetical protein [Pseudovibrio sp. M1P-2-3]
MAVLKKTFGDGGITNEFKGKHATWQSQSYKYEITSGSGDDDFYISWKKAYEKAYLKGINADLGDGDDKFYVNLQNGKYSNDLKIYIDAGAGDDLINLGDIKSSSKQSSTVIGGSGDDTIYTSNADSLVYGDHGPDDNSRFDSSKSYNDLIVTGSGDDEIHAGYGNDVIFSGDGSDTIYAETGTNLIHVGGRTGQDIDTVYAGDGADLIITGGLKSEYISYYEGSGGTDWVNWSIGRGFVTANSMASLAMGSTVPGLNILIGLGFNAAMTAALGEYARSNGGSIVSYAQQDYTWVKDFDMREDVFLYTATATDNNALSYWKSTTSNNGEYEIWTDVDDKSNGGLIARVAPDSDLVAYIQESSGAGSSAKVISKQLSDQMAANEFQIRYYDGKYYDSAGNELSESDLSTDMGSGTTLQDSLDSIGLEDGQTLIMSGAYSGQIINGEDITSSNGNLYLTGTNFADVIFAMNSVKTNQSDDTYLYGFDGDDWLVGGDGDDMLFGGTGDDKMTGVNGSNTFVFEENAGNDIITDFTIGQDTLKFYKDGVTFEDLVISQIDDDQSPSGTATYIEYNNNTITLWETDSQSLTQDDMIFA